jgi:hypothetical protein
MSGERERLRVRVFVGSRQAIGSRASYVRQTARELGWSASALRSGVTGEDRVARDFLNEIPAWRERSTKYGASQWFSIL